MQKITTLTAIEARYRSEWVLIADPEAGKDLVLRRGRVLCHSKDRDEVYRRAVALRPRSFALLYTGTLPKGSAVIL